MSSQPPMGSHLVIPRNGISYTNEPPMSSHLPLKATFPVSQGLLLIAGSTVVIKQNGCSGPICTWLYFSADIVDLTCRVVSTGCQAVPSTLP